MSDGYVVLFVVLRLKELTDKVMDIGTMHLLLHLYESFSKVRVLPLPEGPWCPPQANDCIKFAWFALEYLQDKLSVVIS